MGRSRRKDEQAGSHAFAMLICTARHQPRSQSMIEEQSMRTVLMIAFAVMLASCGGGGDSTGAGRSNGTPSGNDDAMGNMPLDMTSDEIAAALAQIQGRADARLWSELVMRDGTRHNTATLGNDYTFAGATYVAPMIRNGVNVVQGRSEHEVDGVCCQSTRLLGG